MSGFPFLTIRQVYGRRFLCYPNNVKKNEISERYASENNLPDRRPHGRWKDCRVPAAEIKIREQCIFGRRLVLGFASFSGYGGNQEDGAAEYLFSAELVSSLLRL